MPDIAANFDRYAHGRRGWGSDGVSRRQRMLAFLLAALITALLPLGLLMMGVARLPGGGHGVLVAVNLDTGQSDSKPAAQHAPSQARSHSSAAANAAAPPRPPVIVPSPNKVELPEGFIMMSHDQYASSDLSHVPASPGKPGGGAEAGGAGHGEGEGPGGAHLYNAEWYREPSDAQIDGYLRPGQNTGRWAMIACRTIENYHVEDCQELGEEPPGTGMARVLREAAWQFLVRPPRINGKPMLGTWVRIRFDFTKVRREAPAPLGD